MKPVKIKNERRRVQETDLRYKDLFAHGYGRYKMNLSILKIEKIGSSCQYEIFLDDIENSKDFHFESDDDYDLRLFDDTLANVKKGDDIYILEIDGEKDYYLNPKLIKEFDEAKIIMERISNNYVNNTLDQPRSIVNNVTIDHNIYSRQNIKSFEKDIQIANHHLRISIYKVRVH